jgi:hypothetical protein
MDNNDIVMCPHCDTKVRKYRLDYHIETSKFCMTKRDIFICLCNKKFETHDELVIHRKLCINSISARLNRVESELVRVGILLETILKQD